jgi:UTP--glucose-1-phosphate uridylyltransferase
MVANRPFFCLLSDNIVRPGHDVLTEMAAGSDDGQVSVMCLRRYPEEYLDKYGFVIPRSDVVDDYLDLGGAVEKPGVDNAPSNLGLVGRYLFTPEVFTILDKIDPGFGGEIQLTDAINELGVRGRLRGFVAESELLDTGTPQGLIHATTVLGSHQFGPEVLGL